MSLTSKFPFGEFNFFEELQSLRSLRLADLHQCEFYLLRYAQSALSEEAVNVGIILRETGRAREAPYRAFRFFRDWSRVPASSGEYLRALQADLEERFAGGGPPLEQMLNEIPDAWSNQLRCTDPRALLTESPTEELERLASLYLWTAGTPAMRGSSARGKLRRQMQRAFEASGVWQQFWKNIEVSKFTGDGDPLKIDCGYKPNGIVRMFHAVPLESEKEAKALAFSYPALAAALAKRENAESELTAVVEDALDRANPKVSFSLRVLEGSHIHVATASQLPAIAEQAARELR